MRTDRFGYIKYTIILLAVMSNFFARAFSQEIRKPAFAGTWYEADEVKLREQLSVLLQSADRSLETTSVEPNVRDNQPVNGAVLAIVVPHAGYMFSGDTAAFAYQAAARSRTIKRVFLLGPSHYSGFRGCALPSERAFATPLGNLEVDREVVDELASHPGFELMPEVHRREHSLELQLPFLRETFGEIKIVPIIVGQITDPAEIQMAAHVIKRYLQGEDLVVVSSDFTHFGPRYDYEPFKTNVRENLRRLDEQAFQLLNEKDLAGFIAFKERTQDTICGFFPCSILISMLPEGSHASLLRYRTSQDVVQDKEQNSVSYLAIAFSNKSAPSGWTDIAEQPLKLSQPDRQALLCIARKALETYVREKRTISPVEIKDLVSPAMQHAMGAFVTLYKRVGSGHSREEKELRGCVGYIFPIKPLVQAVIENAVASASRDYRFTPVEARELESLVIDINALTPPRRIKSVDEIVLGRDGILMYKAGRQSVFLPSVATDFGWDLKETLDQLSIKAGFSRESWKDGAKFDVFESICFEEP